MSREVFSLTRSRKLWVFLLPLLVVSIGFTLAAVFGRRVAPPFAAAAVCVTAALAAAEGMLVSRDCPKARALETSALQLQAVYQVITKAGRSLELQEVLDAITALTVEVTGVRGCSIKLRDTPDAEEYGRGDMMRVRSLSGMRRDALELTVDAAENIYARSLLNGESVRVEGAQERDFPELDGEAESLVCVPLRHEGRVVGAMCVYSEKGTKLPPETLSFLSRLGDLVVLSIQNASVYEGLKRIDRAKTWFLLKASHELKSPLAGILSICQTILGGYLGEITAKQRELIERVRFRSMLLLETANDLLALARAKAQTKGEPHGTLDLRGVLEETVRFYQAAAGEKKVALEVSTPSDPLGAVASPEEIRSVMSNLISNAIKYSPSGSTVSVSLAQGARGAAFSVRDRGIGIPESEREGLFKEFFRATNARSMTEAGTGLGLAIVKSVVDGLGGSIEVQTAEGKGTTITVDFGKAG
jgi:signal transduction histidine kinase